MEYSIPEHRVLNLKEIELLNYLFNKEKPEWVSLIPQLKVIARCGCGECPTILLGQSLDSEILPGSLIIDYIGKDSSGHLIGISVFGTDQMPTQLELFSVDGIAVSLSIPEIFTLERASFH